MIQKAEWAVLGTSWMDVRKGENDRHQLHRFSINTPLPHPGHMLERQIPGSHPHKI